MTDKEKIIAYIDKLLEKYPKNYYLLTVAEFIDSLQEEPVSNPTLLCRLSDSVGIEEAVKETEEYKEWQGDPERQQSFIDFAKFGANYKHHTSKDLEEAATKYARKQVANSDYPTYNDEYEIECAFETGAQWQKEHLWKSAEGPDLPNFDREVMVLYQRHPLENSEYAVGFGHRPKEYWDGKNIDTGEIIRYYPKRYDKGGWNSPDVKFWLDCELPKTEE